MQLYTCWYCSMAWSWARVSVTGVFTPSPVISTEVEGSARAAGGATRLNAPASSSAPRIVAISPRNHFCLTICIEQIPLSLVLLVG
ncbi:hypothetical protein L7E55_11700 [Pelotomaculum isophthalicicum JI]|uniref:Uncharacterized protein n=1 Tax=Pelotomaculum isophthalicicum JI TaxID=947010 RepID=A0A9X4H3C8_9FIRM|nr:hypothetical protein [Pelotomaculum isophthalicicum]MDF9409016.1 hypothetical protein [Pelotomaculum isophthalicicum JI]